MFKINSYCFLHDLFKETEQKDFYFTKTSVFITILIIWLIIKSAEPLLVATLAVNCDFKPQLGQHYFRLSVTSIICFSPMGYNSLCGKAASSLESMLCGVLV